MKKFLIRNGLSLTLLTMFALMWVGQCYAGLKVANAECALHGVGPFSFAEYFHSSHFWEATFENWESEFLQMAVFVILTMFLYQWGSSESNPLPGEGGAAAPPMKKRYFARRPFLRFLYENSLSLALFGLFLFSFAGHFWSGLREENAKRMLEGALPPLTATEFLGDATFWFQSLQNWQSEFLSIAVIVVLSIFLRQKGSSQSKAVDAPHARTGE